MPRIFTYYNKIKRPEIKKIKYQEDYIDYEIKQVKKSTGPNEDDFEVINKEIEIKTNIREYINSYKDKVGIDAILKQFDRTGDLSLFNQVPEMHADLTGLPEMPPELAKNPDEITRAFAKIDPELRGKMTPKEFIESLNQEKLDAYLNKLVEKKLAAGEGEVK